MNTTGNAVIEDFQTTCYMTRDGSMTTSLKVADVATFGYGQVNKDALPESVYGFFGKGERCADGVTWTNDDGEIVARVVFTHGLK